ncbi:MAG TPA: HNH endonuclease [Tepidisphaeraceae bacterium]|nr:HNH endonuclease [Tepidisphaeraceae bacterium]
MDRGKLALKVHKVAKYLAGLEGGAADLEAAEYDRKIKATKFLPDGVKNIDSDIPSTFIPYTGARSKDYKLATYASLFSDAFNLSKTLISMQTNPDWLGDLMTDATASVGNGMFSGRTWHHHEILGIMESVEDKNHADNRHTGGVSFWQILNNRKYK